MTELQYDECIQMILEHDQQGLRRIYEAYMSYIYHFILGILKNKEDAEDVTSAFFVRIWKTAAQYKPGTGHKTYITTIARNMCIDYLRKKSREIPMDISGADEASENRLYQETESPDPERSSGLTDVVEDFSNQVVTRMTLKEALLQVNEEDRRLIHMKILGGMTFKEIAEVMKQPIGTITWKYQNILKKLRRYGYE